MAASISKSTSVQYNVVYNKWFKFCECHNFDAYKPNKNSILRFLTDRYKDGVSYGTVNSDRSALSLILDNKIGADEHISRFCKGVAKLRPPKPKYAFTWNVAIVLNYFKTLHPLEELTFSQLSYKTVMLLLLVTGHRAQTIASIKLENILSSKDGVLIYITDKMKISAPGQMQPLLYLPFCIDNPKNCVATILLYYCKVSKSHRLNNERKCFIATRKPFKGITAQTVSRWAKLVLEKSGIDLTIFSAHSTRYASTSSAHSKGVDIDTIKELLAGQRDLKFLQDSIIGQLILSLVILYLMSHVLLLRTQIINSVNAC
ncbi:uncharacterized protein LOC131666787 isoform X1 [Phymastichus coffea]|uniref:uncharacterized protein LOC131666787 isoform X1 n=1 Tax=Phymastichus coffea TaxID=108790 RepID=UPI00273BE2B1|nr:uncharacterized protein LOC131666787 isoform X1 [Phymastichus coffea]